MYNLSLSIKSPASFRSIQIPRQESGIDSVNCHPQLQKSVRPYQMASFQTLCLNCSSREERTGKTSRLPKIESVSLG